MNNNQQQNQQDQDLMPYVYFVAFIAHHEMHEAIHYPFIEMNQNQINLMIHNNNQNNMLNIPIVSSPFYSLRRFFDGLCFFPLIFPLTIRSIFADNNEALDRLLKDKPIQTSIQGLFFFFGINTLIGTTYYLFNHATNANNPDDELSVNKCFTFSLVTSCLSIMSLKNLKNNVKGNVKNGRLQRR